MTKDQREFKARWDETRAKCEAAEKAFSEYKTLPPRERSSKEYKRLFRELKRWECALARLSYEASRPTENGRIYALRERGEWSVSWHSRLWERKKTT